MPLISVIVPIYNMEKLMRKCLDSILAQTFQDYECLLIDDGSIDGSPAICEEYAAKYSRFKAFHKPNGGLSDARNFGLERAQGEYTIFFDPDDWVDEDCLKDMYAKAQESDADMVMCDIYYDDAYSEKYSKQEPSALDHYSVLEDIVMDRVQGFTVIKLIRRILYQQYNILYPTGIYGCEDQYTICALLKNEIKIAYLPKAYYHYMHYGNETQSRKYDIKVYQMDIHTRDMFSDLLKDSLYHQLAYEKKTFAIFYRAFHFGKNTFSSEEFQKNFYKMSSLIDEYGGSMKPLYKLSINGYYHFSRKIFQIGYDIKQLLKKNASYRKKNENFYRLFKSL